MKRTFSDNWYRVADLRVGLRPGVSIRLHHYRGEPWYVLHERAHNGFFRVNPATYRFISRIAVDLTLDEVWRAAVEDVPEDTPGQEEVFELVAALYRANLIYVEGGVDEASLVERFQRKKKKPFLARVSELLFLRIPLFDPEPWLSRSEPAIRVAFSWPMRLLVLAVMAWGGVEFAQDSDRALEQAGHILQLDNLLLLYLAIFASHALHELGHAALSKYFGGEVRTMGVMLLLFTPLPYVDLSSNWAFRDRYQRALVAGAGMMVDLAVSAVATIVWAHSPPGTVNEIAYNLMFTTAVYTVLFNINPLMRFDGYYILADLIDIPNLHEKAKAQFEDWWKKHVLMVTDPSGEEASPRRRLFLIAFYLASNAYRLMIMFGIVLFVADQYFGVGLMVAIALAINSFVLPLKKTLAPLRSPLFMFQHRQLVRRGAWGLGGLLALLLLLPLPDSYVLTGVVEARRDARLFTESGGVVERVPVRAGQWVEAGTALVYLSNPELDAELRSVAAQLRQAETQEAKALTEGGADLDPLRERLATLDTLRLNLERQRAALVVQAPHAGIWVDADSRYKVGSWVGRGAELGRVVDDREHDFLGVIRQEAASALAEMRTDGSRVRIEGQRDEAHPTLSLTLLPHSQRTLPSAALSPLAGGDIAVSAADPSGKESVEAFFLLRAELAAGALAGSATVWAGRTGWIKVRLPAKPLAVQGWRAARQFLQRRYQL